MTKLDFYLSPNPPYRSMKIEANGLAFYFGLDFSRLESVRGFIRPLCGSKLNSEDRYYLYLYGGKNRGFPTEVCPKSLSQFFGTDLQFLFSVNLPIEIDEPLNLTCIRILYKAFAQFKQEHPEYFL